MRAKIWPFSYFQAIIIKDENIKCRFGKVHFLSRKIQRCHVDLKKLKIRDSILRRAFYAGVLWLVAWNTKFYWKWDHVWSRSWTELSQNQRTSKSENGSFIRIRLLFWWALTSKSSLGQRLSNGFAFCDTMLVCDWLRHYIRPPV